MKKPKPIWVVYLDNGSRTNRITDKKYVRAPNEQSALKTAKEFSITLRGKKVFGKARLADPVTDLGMTKTEDTLNLLNNTKEQVRAA